MNHKFFEYQTKEIKRTINDESPQAWYWLMIYNKHIYIKLVIMTSPFYSRTLLSHPLPVLNAVSIFRNDRYRYRKVYLQSKARMPTAVLAIFILFYLFFLGFVIIKNCWVNIVNIVRTCLRTHCKVLCQKRRQAVQYVCKWKHLYHGWPFLTRQLQRGRDNHCGNEVGRWRRDIEI